MATSAAIETLLIKIGADVVDLKKGMEDANKSLQKFEDTAKSTTGKASQAFTANIGSMVKAMAAITAAVVAVHAAFSRFGSALDRIDALQRMSAQTGIAVSRLDELARAAELAGVPFEALQQAITGFQQRLAEGLGDRLSAVSLSLRQLGVEVRDQATGALRSFSDLLPEIAESLSQFQNGLGKAQIASALFGEEAGPRMLRLLNQGAEGIRRFVEEARRSGVVSEEQTARAEAFRVANVAMQQSIDGLVRELVTRLAPAVTFVAGAITGLLRLLPQGNVPFVAFGRSAEELVVDLDATTLHLQSLEAEIRRLNSVMIGGRGGEAIAAALGIVSGQAAEARRRIEGLTQALSVLQAAESQNRQARDLAAERRDAQEAIQQAQHDLQILNERLTSSRELFDPLNFAWDFHARVVERATERIGVAYATEGERRRALENINRQMARSERDQILQTADLLARTITSIFPAQKGAAIAAAIINTAVGITRALSIGFPPWNWIQAGLIAASGAAQIATIRSTTESGGGSAPSVNPGGGEGEPQGDPSRMLTITGIQPADLFTGATLRGLIERINGEVQNGVTLISTRTS